MTFAYQNLNGNLLCSIDTETTGTRPHFHDIVQIAIIPLDNDTRPDKNRMPFVMDLCPKNKDNVDSEAMRINRLKLCDIIVNGTDPYRAADLLMEWFEKQRLGPSRRLTPLGCNWPFDREFIMEWLGRETYDFIFDSAFRDVLACANYQNDRDGYLNKTFTYQHVSLRSLCNTLEIERVRGHDACDDARVTAEVYRKMLFGAT